MVLWKLKMGPHWLSKTHCAAVCNSKIVSSNSFYHLFHQFTSKGTFWVTHVQHDNTQHYVDPNNYNPVPSCLQIKVISRWQKVTASSLYCKERVQNFKMVLRKWSIINSGPAFFHLQIDLVIFLYNTNFFNILDPLPSKNQMIAL